MQEGKIRLEPVVFMCDIKGMFDQVKVTMEHRNFLRFLWWKDGNPNNPIVEYRVTVHLFGAASSSACSNFALKRTADDNESEFGSKPADFNRGGERQTTKRRSILFTVSFVFVPLGMVAPFLLKGKQVLQQLCKENVSWDKRLPSLCPAWEDCKNDLPRTGGDKDFPMATASVLPKVRKQGSLLSSNGKVKCHAAQVSNHTRWKLASALVSVNVSAFLKKELAYNDIDELFYSDSKVVLGYISNEARRFHTYVANRVQ
ncbi:hypothetical protein QZH41_020593 [Actinostola sp. cb2023]|nr:hypothetical protein QZH41_020593 [Actinostola sp. cb2023]